MASEPTHLWARLSASTLSKTRYRTFTATVVISLVIGVLLAFALQAKSKQLHLLAGRHSNLTTSHALSPGVIGTDPPSPTNLYCLMYEKNHRTGSTTVEKYLEKCFANRPGIERCLVQKDSTGHWMRCLQEKQSNVSVMFSSDHLRLDDNDMISIMLACGELAVIRTSRPVSERRFSRFKYSSCSGGSCVGKDLNTSNLETSDITSDKDSFWDWTQPYYSALRFQPTRILENSKLDQELAILGKELGCDLEVQRANVHESSVSVKDAMGKVVDGEVHRHNLFVKSWLREKEVNLWRKLKGKGVFSSQRKWRLISRFLDL